MFCYFHLNSNCFSFYTLTLYSTLIERAEIIVHGKIISINKFSFEIEVKEIIKGINFKKNISINKFENTTCARRYSKYEIGQEAIYFIKRKNNSFDIMGNGNEGEIKMINSIIFLKNIYHNNNQNEILDYKIVVDGINDYLFNEKKINYEFENFFSRNMEFKNSILDKLYKINEFLKLVLIQRNNFGNHKLEIN